MSRKHLLAALALLLLSMAPCTSTAAAADLVVKVRDVIDGDTVILDDGRKVRYLGINAPEHGQPFAREATDVNRRMVGGVSVRLELDQIREDRHGRLLAYVHRDGKLVNEQLLAEGVAHVFSIPPNTRYAERFLQAQRVAKGAKKGMWRSVRGPLKITRIEPKGDGEEGKGALAEFVRIANISDQVVDLAGYSITDRDGHRYDFPPAKLRPGHVLTLVTGKGHDRRDETAPIVLHWNRRRPVWNDRKDTAILTGPMGERVDRFDYKTSRRRPQPLPSD